MEKRNSILRSSAAPEEKTTDSVRIKRRISFNKRKSVREFCASEETKAWNTSYDVSDPKNHSNETVGEKSTNNKSDYVNSLQTTTRFTANNVNEKENYQIDSTYNNNNKSSSRIANHRDSIALQLRNSSAVVVENNLAVTMKEKERQSRLSNKFVRDDFSFTLLDYEADNFCRTQSLTLEAEKTDFFRHELEERLDVMEKSKNPTQLSRKGESDEQFRFPAPPIDCNMEISVAKLPIAKEICSKSQSTDVTTKNYNINDAMDIIEESPCLSEENNQKTLHFNEDIRSTPSCLNRATNSRRTIIFDSEEPDNAMNISNGHEESHADVSMKEVFIIPKETDDMDLTKIPDVTNIDKAEVKEKPKLIFKHVSVPTPTLKEASKKQKENSNVFTQEKPESERELVENNNKDNDSDAKFFDKNDKAFWNSDDDYKYDSLYLANVTLDSDPTLSEYMLSSGGGKLNYRQLNDELERGRIKLFSATPTPVKKTISTPLSTGLRINLLKTKAGLSCFKDVPENLKKSDNNFVMQPGTPLKKGIVNHLVQETPHRSLIEFEQIELQADIEQMEIEKSRAQSPCMGRMKNLPKRKSLATRFFDNISLNLSKLDIEKEIEETPKSIVGLQNHALERENRRLTVHDPTDMEIEERNKSCSNELKNPCIQKNLIEQNPVNKRQTILVPEEMTIDESLLIEQQNDNTAKFCQSEKGSGNLKSNNKNLAENEENNNLIFSSEELKKFNEKCKTNCLTVSAVQKLILEDCEPISMPPYQRHKNNRRTVLISKPMDIEITETVQNKESEEDVEKQQQEEEVMQKFLKISNKRHTIVSNEPIEMEQKEGQMKNEPVQVSTLMHGILRKSNKRETILSNVPIEIEQDKNNAHTQRHIELEEEKNPELMQQNLRQCNKRQTMLTNEPIDIEQEETQTHNKKEEEDKSEFKLQNQRKSNKRQTMLTNDPIDIEQEETQKQNEKEEEENSELKLQNLRKSNKRQTMLTNDPIDIEQEETQMQNKKEEEYKSELKLQNQRKSNKRQTMLTNDPIDIEQEETQTQNEKEEEKSELKLQNLRKSNKRQTMITNEPIDIEQEETQMQNKEEEEDKSELKLQNLRKSNKRQTTLTNEPIDIEQEETQTQSKKEEEDKSELKLQNLRKSNKRQTMLTNEPIDIEQEESQTQNKKEEEDKSELKVQNLRKSNKRQTMLTNKPIDIEQDNNQSTFNFKLVVPRTLHSSNDQIQYDMDETLVTENFKIQNSSTNYNSNCNINKNRLTVLATKEMEMDMDIDNSVEKINNLEVKEQIRATKHKRCTLRDDLNISLESASPVSKIRNIEIIGASKPVSERTDYSIQKSPYRSESSRIPVLINSAMKTKKSPLRHEEEEEPSGFEVDLDTLPLPRHCINMYEEQHITITDVGINTKKLLHGSIASTSNKPNVSDLYMTNNTSRFNEDLLYLTRDTCSLIENETIALQDSNDANDNKDNDKDIAIVIEDDDIIMENGNAKNYNNEKTFELPKHERLPDLEADFLELKRLRSKPKIADVFAYYRRISMGLPLNLNDVTTPSHDNTCVEDSECITSLNDRYSALMAKFDKQEEILRELAIPQDATIDRLCNLINEKCPNWRINTNKRFIKRLIFHSAHLPYASYLMIYKEENGCCGDIEIIQLKRQKVLCKKNWKPIDYVLDFQLQLEEPHNLMHYYKLNDLESICESMCRIDECCSKINKLGISMWRIVLMQEARLIRIENSTYVEKIVYRYISEENKEYPRVETAEYLIELQDLREICFKNMFKPRPYAFREEFQVFHKGLEFLQMFLEDPEKYLK